MRNGGGAESFFGAVFASKSFGGRGIGNGVVFGFFACFASMPLSVSRPISSPVNGSKAHRFDPRPSKRESCPPEAKKRVRLFPLCDRSTRGAIDRLLNSRA